MVRAPTARSRRELLKQVGLAGAGLGLAARAGWCWPADRRQDDEEVVPFNDIPVDFNPRRYGKLIRLDLRELRSWITPVDEYFTVQHYNVPAIDAARWRLERAGLVGERRSLTLGELKRRPRVERTLFFECAGNQTRGMHALMGNASWAGATLRDLLEESRPSAEAKEVVFWAADQGVETLRGNEYTMNFARSMSMDDAMRSESIVAYELNGQPLPVRHGFPVRLIVPGWYGIANVKWLTKIELIDGRLMNRFMARDYVTVMGRQAGDRVEYTETSVNRMHVKSVVARVTRLKQGGRIKVFGAAWSDGTPLGSVEVRIDDGAWQPAMLEPQGNPFAWTFFSLEAGALPPGSHAVVSRATDGNGRTQPASLELKRTLWEDHAQFKRTIVVPAAIER